MPSERNTKNKINCKHIEMNVKLKKYSYVWCTDHPKVYPLI